MKLFYKDSQEKEPEVVVREVQRPNYTTPSPQSEQDGLSSTLLSIGVSEYALDDMYIQL